ncbi:unnamed protein product [Mytilus coruscus]|uniref:C-type lectin domain-containing protein n=1 Tax=Mytilus coruscus TaxID=42192 RepID=A0A6J8DW87_MYTCO|nr:unnamed protein product [Mytilus coruscus]
MSSLSTGKTICTCVDGNSILDNQHHHIIVILVVAEHPEVCFYTLCTMLIFCHVIVIALSIYQASSAGKLTRQCMASKGRCGRKTDSSCASMFGSGWTEKGRCCDKRPCCVHNMFHCDDILQDQLLNGQTVNITGTEKLDGVEASQYALVVQKLLLTFRGSTYKFICSGFTFHQAEAVCKIQGGNLTTIETEEENSFLKHVVTLIHTAGSAANNNWWIGLTDIKTEGSFEWISGQPVTYTDWFQGPPTEPNGVDVFPNLSADCVMLRHSNGFQWSDDYCSYNNVPAICEIW